MINVRAYEDKDREAVEKICIATAGEKALREPLWGETILNIYCRYYITKAKDFCFVAVNETDTPIGYILCAPDRKEYKQEFLSDEVKAIRKYNLIYSVFALGELILAVPFEKKYPAHLHIDILDGYRHMGIGSELMTNLLDKLQSVRIRGVMLSVAATNKNAINFYFKNGFKSLLRTKLFFVMGKRL